MNQHNKLLKPCPFCGGEAVIIKAYEGYAVAHWDNAKVVCPISHNEGEHLGAYFYDTKEEAAKVWNTRYEPPTPGGAIVPAGNGRLKCG